jgi:hypothetical protein
MQTIMFDLAYETLTAPSPPSTPTHTPTADAPAPAPAEPDLAPDDLAADDEALDSYCDTHTVAEPLPLSTLNRQRKVEAQIVMSATTLLGLDHQPGLPARLRCDPAEIARRIGDTAQINTPPVIRVRRLFADPTDARLLQWTPEPAVQRVATRVRDLPRPDLPPHRWTHPRHRPPETPHPRRTHHRSNSQALRRTRTSYATTPTSTSPPRTPTPTTRHRTARRAAGPPDAPATTDHPADHPADHPMSTGRPDPTPRWNSYATTPRTSNGPYPTGHRYTTEPPPALGHGSTAPTTRSVMELELTLMCQRAPEGS